MKFIEFLTMAFRSLWANKLRSSLTMLGIIIGVGAVITLMSVGRGAQAEINRAFSQLGANVLFIQPRNPDAPGLAGLSPAFATLSLTMDDANAIMKNVRDVIAIAPTNENFVEVSAGGETINSVIHGSTPAYLDVENFKMASGHFISEREVAGREMVVVLGSKAATDIFGNEDPIGQTINIKGKRFSVIGVMEAKGGAFLGFSMDSILIVPITTYQTRLFSQRTASGEDAVQVISVQIAGDASMDEVTQDIKDLLRKRHRIAPDKKNDFAVYSSQQALDIAEQVTGVFTIFLGAISGISLVVGGIGIMNIMLVSVTERTREIGLRKAIGAKRRDILLQFLLEAATLSLAGGGVGILIGWGISTIISMINISGQTIQSTVTSDIILLAISVSAFIGLVSGIYPAVRAASLDPINALHYG
jgi:putative ABC transport system permease protein